MTTIIITILVISILYLIFALKDLKDDVGDIEFRMDILKEICADYEKRIKELEDVRKTEVKRRKSTNRYRGVCKNAQSKAYRLFEGSIRPSYIRAKRNVQWLVYRAKKR